ncbi:MAG: hypothetical protein Q8K60_00980 [Parachlamydiaceae bacterium]|nr:hypothetical protein [Parachlamydiaceae bacterium]
MSAIPKKKLCWNCEGNVARDVDNCPYCGVWVQPPELGDNSGWNPNYQSSSKTEEIPSPLYQINTDESDENEENSPFVNNESKPSSENHLLQKVKLDLFPVIFLMMGSNFFLFGIILLLFSQNGTFTLQWQGSDGLYFILFSIPLTIFGWKYLQQIEE